MAGESRVVARLTRTLARLVIIATLLPSNALVFPVNGLLCYECTGQEKQVFCNSTASIRSCPDQEICIRQLSQRQDWLATLRGCSNSTECRELERGNDPRCLQGVVTTTCTWCCSTDYCNHDGFPEMQKDNTTDLGISESTTTEASFPITSKEKSDCPTLQNVSRCLTQFQESVESVVRGNRSGFASFCRNIPEFFRCLTSSASCNNSTTKSAPSTESAVHLVWERLWDSCPGSCNRTAALFCVLEVFDVVMTFLENQSNSFCDDLLKKVRGGFQCTALSVGSCEDGGATMAAADRVLHDLESAALSFCPRLPSGEDPDNSLQMMTKVQLPPCRLEEAMHCISQAGVDIIKNRIQHNGSSVLCNERSLVEGNMSCARSRSDPCVLVRRKRALLAEAVVDRLLGRSCDARQPLFGCNTTAARLCIVDLMRMAEGPDIQEACNSLEETKSFVKLKTEECREEEKQSLNRTLSQVLSHVAKYCTPSFECLSKETIFLTEGGKPEVVAVRITAPPKVICSLPGCKVTLDILPDMKGPPNCRNKSPISQFLVLEGADGLCSRHVTGDSLDGVHAFHLAAKIDFKYDNVQQRALRLVMRKVVNGTQVERRTICEHKVVVVDRDRQSVCQSVTDPHIMTFDGRAYNNFLEGFFTLYQHRLFPYEVQVAFQRCVRGGATCTCAVAVRAGDSVFFVDRCRKRAPVEGRTWHRDAACRRGQNRVACSDFETAKMFYHEKITPGFRVHSRGDTGFELLLPHGTRVVIRGAPWYNVFVYPSPFDWNQTEGLCGTYDNQPKNDLTLRNSRLFRESLSHRSEPPLDFSLDWRVSEGQLLTNGVERSPFRLPVHCDCEKGSGADGSPVNLCGSSRILELCDFNSEGEITFKLPKGNQRSSDDDSANSAPKKSRRDIGGGSKTYDAYDFDLHPDVDIDQFGNWTKALALQHCERKLLNESDAIRNCVKYLHDFDTEFALESCVEDLLLSGEVSFVDGALSVLKVQCAEQLASNVSLYNSDEGRFALLEVEETLCMEDCGLHGICFRGRCHCEPGFTGSSCGTSTWAAPGSVALVNGGLCDLSQVDCSWAVVVGGTFINMTNLVCLLQETQFTVNGTVAIGSNATVPAVFISAHQVLCPIGGNAEASYFISVSNNGANFSERQVFLARDLTCHECRLNVTDGQVCQLKAYTCLVSDKCYSSGEEHRNDPCLVCDPSRSTVELYRRGGHGCSSHSQNVLTAMLVTLAVVACLIAVALVYRLKRKSIRSARLKPKEVEKPKEQQTAKVILPTEGHTNAALETIPE